MKNKRGIFFSLDVLIALAIILTTLLIVYPILRYSPDEKDIERDVIEVLATLKVGEINDSYVKQLINDSEIKDKNKSILEQIGEFYITNRSRAKEFSSVMLTYINTSDNIGIWYGDNLLASKNSTAIENASTIRVEKQLISGISNASWSNLTTGFSGRAYLYSNVRTRYFYFGGYVGDGNLSLVLNYSGNIRDAELEIAINNDFDIYINGNYSGHYQNSSSEYDPAKYDISAYIGNFTSGMNTVKFVGDDLYIAGGYIKIVYDNASVLQNGRKKYYFPGIEGIINLYDGFYIPGTLNAMEAVLHLNTSFVTYLIIGNTTIFRNSTNDEETIIINDSNFSSLLNYSELSNKTIPLRLGLENVSLSLGGKSDAALITDRTPSMDDCDVDTSCTGGLCDTTPPCHDRRDIVAQNSDRQFINEMLNIPGNEVGLIGYGQKSNSVCSFMNIGGDNQSMQDRIDDYYDEWCGYTCISCGIVSAAELLLENKALHGAVVKSDFDGTEHDMGDAFAVYINESFDITINDSAFIKSRLTLFTRRINVRNSDFRDCVFLNNYYLGRLCDPREDDNDDGWHTCSYAIKEEWFLDGENNVTITAGDNTDCFSTGGDQDEYTFREVELKVWESDNQTINKNSFFDSSTVTLDDVTLSRTINFNTGISSSDMRAGYLSFEALDVNPSRYDCVFINDHYIGRIDYEKWSGDNVWQEILFEIPVMALNDSDIDVKITTGNSRGCELDHWFFNADSWDHRNVNLTVIWGNVTNKSSYDRYMSMLVMSDGQANTKIGHTYNYDSGNADNEAIDKACEAASSFGIKIFSVAFGGGADEDLMRDIACCDDCSHAYNSSNSTELIEIYKQIANEIIKLDFAAQTANLTGNISTFLYPDSYIDFNYTEEELPYGLFITSEVEDFNNGTCNFSVPNDSIIVDAKAISYSGPMWTDNVFINNITVYNLSYYGDDFIELGDPYNVHLPIPLVNESNVVRVSAGLAPGNSTPGSDSDKIIYSVVKEIVSYSPISPFAEGCNWTILFEDNTSLITTVPLNYSGSNKCYYNGSYISYNAQDAIQAAVYDLLSQLDFDSDGLLDVKFVNQDLIITYSEVRGIPYGWWTEMQIRTWE